ncbi:class I tRNA ligase family protein [Patescibacteria group bacterium]|nr:class I tRNA ligase family protein [Patescibacteria group bacterium]
MLESKRKISETAKREEEILAFWQKNQIFEKSLEKRAPKGEFVFYDGPPFATGLPHAGNLLSSIIKDVIPRYKTMRGYHVRRRWGWDCHGLPIENMVEGELGLKTKKEIEEIGVEKFNQTCRDAVLRCEQQWKKYIDRIGRWVHFDDSYKTMDNSFIESVWWGLKQIYDKKLLYEGRKVLLYCPHCETPLAKAEIAQDRSYKDITEEAVTVKFKVKNPKKHNLPKNTFLLAWTTTPWTLPGNVALAVGRDIVYGVVAKGDEHVILATKILATGLAGEYTKVKEIKGKELLGIEYEPLFEVLAIKDTKKKSHYVTEADFVTTDEGTGIVHTAVMYGEDDYDLGFKINLPQVQLLNPNGHFNDLAPKLIRGEYFKKAEKKVKDDLEKRGLMFSRDNYTHSYPHCHRCGTALLYNALSSWFINIQKIKRKLIKNNKKINWFPGHLKNGRFLHNLKSAPDWTISRNRYWASPLPIWKSKGGDIVVIGSLAELKSHIKSSLNTYTIMRHGGADSNVNNIISADNSVPSHLTELGRKNVSISARKLSKKKIDLIFASPLFRTQETAEIVRETLGLPKNKLITEERIREIQSGVYNGRPIQEYRDFFSSIEEKMVKRPKDGENILDMKKRIAEFLYEIDAKYTNKNILIVTHEYGVWMIDAIAKGATTKKEVANLRGYEEDYINTSKFKSCDFVPLPHNENFELDLHRPYIDNIKLVSKGGEELERVPEVLDGWVDSGSVPFAEYHYPFENKKVFEKRSPGDFIAEYIGQTRTWFYYLHVLGTALFGDIAFKNVITTGNILAEDGSKIAKSKNNFTDPMELINEFGSDALRYYLMRSVVMQAEDMRFTDNDVKEVKNRLVTILFNIFKFYGLYKDQYNASVKPYNSKNVLDKWILSRLAELNNEVTNNLEGFNTIKASRPIREFVTDFSTWYVRRSRDRFKGDDEEDKQYALATTRFVLIELSKLIAPFMPFIAEIIYLGVSKGEEKESVHLESWPIAGRIDKKLLEKMTHVRNVVSASLEARELAGTRVRQPLQTLFIGEKTLEKEEELLSLILSEVNIKEIVFKKSLGDKVGLNTHLSPELIEEGTVREVTRFIQSLRKKQNFATSDYGHVAFSANKELKDILERNKESIQKTSLLSDIIYDPMVSGDTLTTGDHKLNIRLTK